MLNAGPYLLVPVLDTVRILKDEAKVKEVGPKEHDFGGYT